MAYKYALRTDKCFDSVRDFIVSKNMGGWAVRESVDGGNEHFHWYLETDMKAPAFRVALTRAVPDLRGNAGYSLSVIKDVDKYLRYMAKGESDGAGPNRAWSHGLLWTDEKLEELHTEYWAENRRLKKRKVGTVTDAVVDKCKADAVRWDDRRRITEIYIRELISRDKAINTFALKAAVNLIQVKLCPNDDALHELVDRASIV